MGDTMNWTFDKTAWYLNRIGLACPKEINPLRWRAMVRQVELVYGHGWLMPYYSIGYDGKYYWIDKADYARIS